MSARTSTSYWHVGDGDTTITIHIQGPVGPTEMEDIEGNMAILLRVLRRCAAAKTPIVAGDGAAEPARAALLL